MQQIAAINELENHQYCHHQSSVPRIEKNYKEDFCEDLDSVCLFGREKI